ncbi:hypothetical protein B0H13DRAFT_1886601 [Mycena leptocephala]|nr:hypothetical protein B0H13DRAFT_1886601 [Mycena leptocephala]
MITFCEKIQHSPSKRIKKSSVAVHLTWTATESAEDGMSDQAVNATIPKGIFLPDRQGDIVVPSLCKAENHEFFSSFLFGHIIKFELKTALHIGSEAQNRVHRPIPVSVKWKTTVCSALLFEYIIKIELQTAFNVRPIPVSVKQKTTVCLAFLFEHIIKIELQTAFNVRSEAQDWVNYGLCKAENHGLLHLPI